MVVADTLPGGLFKSDDLGVTWTLVESLWRVPERQFFHELNDTCGWSVGEVPQAAVHACMLHVLDQGGGLRIRERRR